jgi:hypothetical protein
MIGLEGVLGGDGEADIVMFAWCYICVQDVSKRIDNFVQYKGCRDMMIWGTRPSQRVT